MGQHLAAARPLEAADRISIEFMVRDLARSGLVPEDLGAYAVAAVAMGRCGGYCIPYEDPRMYRVRYDRDHDKYIGPKGMVGVWSSPRQDRSAFRTAPELWLVEGEKKAAALVKRWPHLPALGLGGCWMFGRKVLEHFALLPEILDCVRPGMGVCVVFDADVETNPTVQRAAFTLHSLLEDQGCNLRILRPPQGKGLDDFLVEDTAARLEDLVEKRVESLAVAKGVYYERIGVRRNDKGIPLPTLLNALKLLNDYYASDENRLEDDRRLGLMFRGGVTQFEDIAADAMKYIQGEHMATCPYSTIKDAVTIRINESKVDYLQRFVAGLAWDGVPRLCQWGPQHLETDMPAYCAEWGRLLMTGLALRLLRPGCKVDYVYFLVGPQGIGKTTFLEELAEFEDHRHYYPCTQFNNVDATLGSAFEKAAVVDLGEGAVFDYARHNQENLRQLITQRSDTWRGLYKQGVHDVPRGFVFCGTSNKINQLTDTTGSRRNLPLRVSRIVRLPYEEKLQLMAEVVALEREGLLRDDSDWWELQVRWEDLSQAVRAGNEHIASVQAIINQQFMRGDDFADYVADILESEDCARFIKGVGLFVSAPYLYAKYNNPEMRISLVGRKLSDLVTNPAFPWRLEWCKPELRTLKMEKDMEILYTRTITNKQMMLTGYRCTRKERVHV